jgi:hypothetical protein
VSQIRPRLTPHRDARRPARSRSNTAHGYNERFNPPEEEPMPEQPRITIPRLNSRNISPSNSHDSYSPGGYSSRPGPSRMQRDISPAPRLSRVTTDSVINTGRANLRPIRANNTFSDQYDDDYTDSNGHRRTPSPTNSQGSALSRTTSWAAQEAPTAKKAPPPPPPSRAKKPPPPPPPMKRSALSSSETSHY